MYLHSVLPSESRRIRNRTRLIRNPDVFAKFSTLPTHQLKDPFPRALRHATLELASSNLICSVALTGVLALQAGRFWAESADSDNEVEEFHSKGENTREILSE